MKKFQVFLLVLTLIISNSLVSYADSDINNAKLSNVLSRESVEFLETHNVDLDSLQQYNNTFANQCTRNIDYSKQSLNDEILSLKKQTIANGFSDKQVQDYLDGLMSYPTEVVGENLYSTRAANRPNDDGIGYEVKSKSGYYQTTAFAKIPEAYRGDYNDTSAYMFWTLKDKVDIGIWYSDGSDGTGWRVSWNRLDAPMDSVYKPIGGLYAGRNVYFNIEVLNGQYARIKIFDANNFSNKICDYSIYIGGLDISRTNNNFNRQITLCRKDANFTGGAYIKDARFWDAYIYSSNGYFKTTSNRCVSNHVGAFGTKTATRRK